MDNDKPANTHEKPNCISSTEVPLLSDDECAVPEPLWYGVLADEYNNAICLLETAMKPQVEFIEDMDVMRKKASVLSGKSLREAYKIFSSLAYR